MDPSVKCMEEHCQVKSLEEAGARSVQLHDLRRLDLRISSDIVAQHNCFRDFLHGYTFLAALSLQRKIGLLFVQAEIALQNALGTLDDFPGLQLFGECGVRLLEARQFKFGAYEKDLATMNTPEVARR